ncbi:unannotated protein [freshwater metagenome]|uniref:Unannotated protein n=1 Tax=freshwater metagenome TaxID=449393 RepID=A0A6J6I771_9ZZZZ
MFIKGGEAGVVACLGQRLGEYRFLEAACVGESLTTVHDDPYAHALRLRRRKRFDLAAIHADLCFGAAHDNGFELLTRTGHCHDAIAEGEKILAHAAVPPMVSDETRSVGTPSPTGTPCPSLPQVPGGPMAKSFPSASMR